MSRTYRGNVGKQDWDKAYRGSDVWWTTWRTEARAAEMLIEAGAVRKQRPLVRGRGCNLFNPWDDYVRSSYNQNNWRGGVERRLEELLVLGPYGKDKWNLTDGPFRRGRNRFYGDWHHPLLRAYYRHLQEVLLDTVMHDLYPGIFNTKKWNKGRRPVPARRWDEDAGL